MIRLTNDTTTLNGALREVAEKLATNLTTKGVQSQYSEGLTSLANKVLTISSGSQSDIELEESNITTYTGEFVVEATITNNNEPAEECEVLLLNIDDLTESYVGLTDEDGIVTFELTTDVQTKNYIMIALGKYVNLQVVYNKYIIDADVGIIADDDGDATISAKLYQWSVRVENVTIQLLLNNQIIDSENTNNNGEINFDVNVDKTTYFKLRYYYSNNDYIEKTFGVEYNPEKYYKFKFDGTETLVNLQSYGNNLTAENGEFKGDTGYISNICWNNHYDWTFECDLQIINSNTGIALMEAATQRDKGGIYLIYNGSRYALIIRYRNGNTFQDKTISNIDFSITKRIKILKNEMSVSLYVDNVLIETITDHRLLGLKELYLGLTDWNNSRSNSTIVSNAEITYYETPDIVYKTIYQPELNGTEQITITRNNAPIILDNNMYCYWDFAGYLTEGFLNYPNWKIEADVKKDSANASCGVVVVEKGVTSRDYHCIYYESNGTFNSLDTHGRHREGEMNNIALTTDWQHIIIKKESDNVISTTFTESNKIGYLEFDLAKTASVFCVGVDSWSANSSSRIKNIVVQRGMKPLEEIT